MGERHVHTLHPVRARRVCERGLRDPTSVAEIREEHDPHGDTRYGSLRDHVEQVFVVSSFEAVAGKRERNRRQFETEVYHVYE